MGEIDKHIVEANVKLQDENNVLKDDKKILNLRVEEKDKVINDLLSRIAKLEYEVERLENQNKSINEVYELTKKEYIRLNNIINKAIEYIEENQEKQYAMSYEYGLSYNELPKLLDILEGSDKE